MSNKEYLERLRQQLLQQLPPLILRHKIKKYLDVFSDNYMAKLDSLGTGPKNRLKLGRKSAYIREDFVDWLINQMEVEP